MEPVDDETIVLARRAGRLGRVTLNRPAAYNALNMAMWRALDAVLSDFAGDPAIAVIAIEGAGDKAFSAGGDLPALHGSLAAGDPDVALSMVRAACIANDRLRTLDKPLVALMDGVVMGAGCALAMPAIERIATERTRFAMPEAGIGFYPDGGAQYFLPKCPGGTGMYLALTGARIGGADAVYLGLATASVPAQSLDALIEALAGGASPGVAAASFAEDTGPAPLAAHGEAIERCFTRDSVAAIVEALEREGGNWAAQTLESLAAKAPFSLEVSFRALRAGRAMSARDCLIAEYRLSTRMLERADFLEGIRTTLIDKGDAPMWQPASLAGVDQAEVEACFASLGNDDLVFP